MDLIRPSGIIPQAVHRAHHVKLGLGERFAIVERLKCCQVLGITLYEIRQLKAATPINVSKYVCNSIRSIVTNLVDKTAAVGCIHSAPFRPNLECSLGSCHSVIDIGLTKMQHVSLNIEH